jgi:NTP pyrophosphatase (non-canonical NTP hydrolase)
MNKIFLADVQNKLLVEKDETEPFNHVLSAPFLDVTFEGKELVENVDFKIQWQIKDTTGWKDTHDAMYNRFPAEQRRIIAVPILGAVLAKGKLDISEFRKMSIRRAIEAFNCYENQPLTFWTTALAGELGELCNMIKKIQRVELGGIDGGHSYTAKNITPEMLKEEIGGIYIYLDLLASLLKISMEDAIIDTFNEKSKDIGWPETYKTIAPPVSNGVEMLNYSKWVKDNWIVGTNGNWRRQTDVRDQRSDEALLREYLLFNQSKQIK